RGWYSRLFRDSRLTVRSSGNRLATTEIAGGQGCGPSGELFEKAQRRGDYSETNVYAVQAAGLVRDLPSARELVERLSAEAETYLGERCSAEPDGYPTSGSTRWSVTLQEKHGQRYPRPVPHCSGKGNLYENLARSGDVIGLGGPRPGEQPRVSDRATGKEAKW
ncbi:MAG: hypothetical protein QOI57_899, partial [Rubrobacteraceae bacterium]|nr:hypothetical protein [Rubrobacteraceae bacterium]